MLKIGDTARAIEVVLYRRAHHIVDIVAYVYASLEDIRFIEVGLPPRIGTKRVATIIHLWRELYGVIETTTLAK